MNLIDFKKDGDTLTIYFQGHIDSKNAPDVEKEVLQVRDENPAQSLVIDCSRLDYISSAGLRIILRLRKECDDLKIVEVSPEVYEVFDMTGFTEMVDIAKAYRVMDVEGCEVIGQGANGKVYRIDPETILKVYFNPEALPEIHRERELARTAFVAGIPTAIPYDVVRVGEGYGSVFELLNAKSLAQLLASGDMDVEEAAQISVDLVKQIHGTTVKPGTMPDMKEVAVDWAHFLEPYLEPEVYAKLTSLVEGVPEDDHMLHGDYHVKNVMIQNGEALLIDMDTLCYGHPIFELASMYNAYQGYSLVDHEQVHNFIGIPYDTASALWHRMLELYLDDTSEERVREVEEKAQIVGCTRMMRRSIRRNGLEDPEQKVFIDACHERIKELVAKYDTLTF